MSDSRVISATFSDWRTVKGRKQLQLIFEVPLEQQAEVLTMLGAPSADAPKWCAIALLGKEVVPHTPDQSVRLGPDNAQPHRLGGGAPSPASQKGKEAYQAKPEWEKAVTRAALLSRDPRFQQWVRSVHGRGRETEADAADFIREWCEVETRAEIGTEHSAYRAFVLLETQYRQSTGQIAEIRG